MGTVAEIELQRAYYDDRWARTAHANLLQLNKAIAILDGIRMINLLSPKILDLGCGNGWFAAILGRFGPTTGVDLSPVAIQKAQARYPDVEFLEGDLFNMPLPREAFDIVVAQQVMEHVEDQRGFVNLAARVLRRGGHFLLVTPNALNLSHWTQEQIEAFTGGLQPIEKWLTRKQLRSLLVPRFKIKCLRTITPGIGDRGILRLAHSVKLAKTLKPLGLLTFYHYALLRAGFGLHILAIAQRL